MRGKPIDDITVADLQQLIADGVAEDRRLEFKVDIPVSAEEQKRQRAKASDLAPLDRSWVNGRSIQDYGRDALAEEIVAFANADGGSLILGMDETSDAPPRAVRINELPDVAGLERRIRDVLLSCVEPRLPYVAVRALPTNSDGSGVILIETSSSVLGPHWVVKTRKPTMRREDRCVPLSMSEVHDMVLRNSRGLESVQSRSQIMRDRFRSDFKRFLFERMPKSRHLTQDEVNNWLSEAGLAVLGAQVFVIPHYDLGIPRLENLEGLIPSDPAISVSGVSDGKSYPYPTSYGYANEYARKVLGGVVSKQEGGFEKTVKVFRDGQTIVQFMQVRELDKCTCYADLIVDAASFACGVYNRLRKRSSYPMAPADLSLIIGTRGNVGVGLYQGFGFNSSYGRLAEIISFPQYILGNSEDVSTMLNEIAYDLMNAGGMSASMLPKVSWNDHQFPSSCS